MIAQIMHNPRAIRDSQTSTLWLASMKFISIEHEILPDGKFPEHVALDVQHRELR